MLSIDEWWPQLHQEVRRWIVNNFWSPVTPYAMKEIARLRGPGTDDQFWDQRDGELYLPAEAIQWIAKSPDFNDLKMPKVPDPRAAYFRRGWPHRQP